MRKYGGIGIPLENVILYDKTKESLEPLISKLKPGSKLHLDKDFIEDHDQMMREFDNDPLSIFDRYDKNEGKCNKW